MGNLARQRHLLRVPRHAVFASVCWGIGQWDAKKVAAGLKARGPNGYDLQISATTRATRAA